MPKKLTVEEKFIRECKKDKNVKWGIKCKGCKQFYQIPEHLKEIHCPCSKIVFKDKKPYGYNAEILYKEE